MNDFESAQNFTYLGSSENDIKLETKRIILLANLKHPVWASKGTEIEVCSSWDQAKDR